MGNLFKWFVEHWKSDNPQSNGQAVHAQNGNHHAVAFDSLRVLIIKDGDEWFAQSIDIDYAATGSSLENVQRNFELGLSATIKAHLERFGNIERIMRTPPLEDRVSISSCDHRPYDVTMVSTHEIVSSEMLQALQYRNISFFQEKLAA